MVYRIVLNVGTAKYSVSYHDGAKKHRDGSPFFDLQIFKSKRKMDAFVRELKNLGYSET